MLTEILNKVGEIPLKATPDRFRNGAGDLPGR